MTFGHSDRSHGNANGRNQALQRTAAAVAELGGRRSTLIVRTMTISFGLSALLSACASHSDSSHQFNPKPGEVAFRGVATDGIYTGSHRATRNEVLTFLRTEGISPPGTQVVSTIWKPKLNKWLIILRHASGVQSRWFVDGPLLNYDGGTYTQ